MMPSLRLTGPIISLLSLLVAMGALAQSVPPEPIDLGSLGGTITVPAAINDSGQVVGSSRMIVGSSLTHAFLWTPTGGMVDLGVLDDDDFSEAVDVNEQGQVAGTSGSASCRGAFRNCDRAFLWTATGGMVDLGTLAGNGSQAVAVNDHGQVVGASRVTPPCMDSPQHCPDSFSHAFSWTATGGMVDLGSLGQQTSYARAVNNSGQVVGDIGPLFFPGPPVHAFSWTPAGGMVALRYSRTWFQQCDRRE